MEPIVFFDSGCGLCQRAARLLLRADRRGRLRFAPLSGETAAALIPAAVREQLPDSLVLRTGEGRLLLRSRALRESLRLAGGLSRLAGAALALLPGHVADAAYDWVARRRRRLFASGERCERPDANWRARLLP